MKNLTLLLFLLLAFVGCSDSSPEESLQPLNDRPICCGIDPSYTYNWYIPGKEKEDEIGVHSYRSSLDSDSYENSYFAFLQSHSHYNTCQVTDYFFLSRKGWVAEFDATTVVDELEGYQVRYLYELKILKDKYELVGYRFRFKKHDSIEKPYLLKNNQVVERINGSITYHGTKQVSLNGIGRGYLWKTGESQRIEKDSRADVKDLEETLFLEVTVNDRFFRKELPGIEESNSGEKAIRFNFSRVHAPGESEADLNSDCALDGMLQGVGDIEIPDMPTKSFCMDKHNINLGDLPEEAVEFEIHTYADLKIRNCEVLHVDRAPVSMVLHEVKSSGFEFKNKDFCNAWVNEEESFGVEFAFHPMTDEWISYLIELNPHYYSWHRITVNQKPYGKDFVQAVDSENGSYVEENEHKAYIETQISNADMCENYEAFSEFEINNNDLPLKKYLIELFDIKIEGESFDPEISALPPQN